MKLQDLQKSHLVHAAILIDEQGIPDNYIFNNYYVEMPNGKDYPFKHLVRTAFQLREGQQDQFLDFDSNEATRNYVAQLGFKFNYYPENINFISSHDLAILAKIGGKPYRKDNPDAVTSGRLIRPLVKKINVWAKLSLVGDFRLRKDPYWQWSGTFRDNLWIRIFKPGASQKVFFALGALDEERLFLKIDCLRSNHTAGSAVVLSKEKQELVSEYLQQATDYQEIYISPKELLQYDWSSLISLTQDYLYRYEAIYDDLESMITNDKPGPITTGRNTLVFGDPPSSTKSYQKGKKSFTGRNTDWAKKQTTSRNLGNAGEQLVIRIEREKLIKAGLPELADQVCKKLDGVGYDILSFDENGEQMHIEVKTTTGAIDEPFYMSVNEVAYLQEYPDNYFLFRLYGYDFDSNSAQAYRLSKAQLKSVVFMPISYEISINPKTLSNL